MCVACVKLTVICKNICSNAYCYCQLQMYICLFWSLRALRPNLNNGVSNSWLKSVELPCRWYTGFPRLLENPGKSSNFYSKISRTFGPGKSWKSTWKVLEFARQWRTWMFLISNRHVMQTKMAIIVSIRYVFWAAGMPKMLSRPGFLPRTCWQSLQRSPRLLSYCLLPYLNIAGLRRGPGKMLLGVWKSPGFFCNQEWEPWIYKMRSYKDGQ